jgi:hypothetical protein
MNKEYNGGVVILKGFTSSWTRNPPEDGNSAGNDPLMDEEPTGGW